MKTAKLYVGENQFPVNFREQKRKPIEVPQPLGQCYWQKSEMDNTITIESSLFLNLRHEEMYILRIGERDFNFKPIRCWGWSWDGTITEINAAN